MIHVALRSISSAAAAVINVELVKPPAQHCKTNHLAAVKTGRLSATSKQASVLLGLRSLRKLGWRVQPLSGSYCRGRICAYIAKIHGVEWARACLMVHWRHTWHRDFKRTCLLNDWFQRNVFADIMHTWRHTSMVIAVALMWCVICVHRCLIRPPDIRVGGLRFTCTAILLSFFRYSLPDSIAFRHYHRRHSCLSSVCNRYL